MISTSRFLPARSRVGTALLVVLLLAGCRGEAPAPQPAAAGTAASANAVETEGRIVRRLERDIITLNPVLTSTSYERDVLSYLFDGLIQIDSKMAPAPGIATRWVVSPDATTFTFYLDPNASFEDGTPVTAADVVFSLKKYAEDSSQLSGYLQGIDFAKTRAVDPATVEIVFESSRSAGQIYAFSFPVIAEHVYGKGDFKKDFNDKVVGNGPYRLVRRTPGAEILLERRDDYKGTKPPIRSVLFKVIPNETIAWSALSRGEIDEMRVSTEQFTLHSGDTELRDTVVFHQFYELEFNFIAWNNRFEPLSDPEIRRALTMAIDRGAVVQHMYSGGARVMSGPFMVEQWAFNPAVAPIPFDPDTSRRILEAKGWTVSGADGIRAKGKKRLSIELLVDAEQNASTQQGQIYQQSLRDVGVDLVVRKLDSGSMIERVISGRYEAAFLGYALDLDPDLYANFHSSQFTPEGQNWVFYSNPEVDELLSKGREEQDQAKRRAMYMRVHEILAADQPYTWLLQPSTKWAVSRQVRNVEVAPGLGLFHWIPGEHGWWVSSKRGPAAAEVKTGQGN